MPHITEEIWQTLTQQPADSLETLALQAYPEADNNLIIQSWKRSLNY